jgi:hypothetical protein
VRQAIERHAREVVEQLQQHREARITTSDPRMRARVLERVRQILSGDVTPLEENSDD